MTRNLRKALLGAVFTVALGMGTADAGTIKVGVIGPMSGPFALSGLTFKEGVEVYQAQHGKTVGGDTIEFIYKDLDAANPAQSKALAQELIVKDKVAFLAGFYFTPDALAVAPLIDEAKIPAVIFNAATSAITEKSPFFVRTSFTLWQNTVPLANYVASGGSKTVVTAVSDYGPGIDAETAFKATFEKAGGKIAESIRMPVAATDFAAFMQRIKDSNADALFAFLPAGPTAVTFVKQFSDNGLRQKMKFFSTGDLVMEPDLPALGEPALGLVTSFHYSAAHKSAANQAFLAKHKEMFGNNDKVTFTTVDAYDGAHVIYKMVEATKGKSDGVKQIAAIKGMKWESPRGPVMIDPDSRHLVQNVYLRTLEKVDGKYQNTEVTIVADQPDFGYKR